MATSFAKVWLLAAQFEIHQLNLLGARAVLRNTIGFTPKDKHARTIFELAIAQPALDKTELLWKLAIAQPALDMPELLWKSEFLILRLYFYWPACVNEHTSKDDNSDESLSDDDSDEIHYDINAEPATQGYAKHAEWSASLIKDETRRRLNAAKLQAKNARLLMNYRPLTTNFEALIDDNFT
nr:hypothetical protein [Tanacetum cinerariifolium]